MATLIGERRRRYATTVAAINITIPRCGRAMIQSHGRTAKNVSAYFGGCSSLLSQANTLPVFRGSG